MIFSWFLALILIAFVFSLLILSPTRLVSSSSLVVLSWVCWLVDERVDKLKSLVWNAHEICFHVFHRLLSPNALSFQVKNKWKWQKAKVLTRLPWALNKLISFRGRARCARYGFHEVLSIFSIGFGLSACQSLVRSLPEEITEKETKRSPFKVFRSCT